MGIGVSWFPVSFWLVSISQRILKFDVSYFFMDSRSDLEYLQSRAGKQAVVDTHVEGIVEYIEG